MAEVTKQPTEDKSMFFYELKIAINILMVGVLAFNAWINYEYRASFLQSTLLG